LRRGPFLGGALLFCALRANRSSDPLIIARCEWTCEREEAEATDRSGTAGFIVSAFTTNAAKLGRRWDAPFQRGCVQPISRCTGMDRRDRSGARRRIGRRGPHSSFGRRVRGTAAIKMDASYSRQPSRPHVPSSNAENEFELRALSSPRQQESEDLHVALADTSDRLPARARGVSPYSSWATCGCRCTPETASFAPVWRLTRQWCPVHGCGMHNFYALTEYRRWWRISNPMPSSHKMQVSNCLIDGRIRFSG
jgi:hypothetical protein